MTEILCLLDVKIPAYASSVAPVQADNVWSKNTHWFWMNLSSLKALATSVGWVFPSGT